MNCEMNRNDKFYHIINFGCQMNLHDSEVIASMLEKMQYEPTEKSDQADIIIVNTCCVRETAENKVFSLLGRLKKMKNKNKDLIIAVGGCMSQQDGMGKKIQERFRHVNIVFGTHNLYQLPDLINRTVNEKKRIVEIWPSSPEQIEDIPERRMSGVRAWVCIMYGCNNFCTYCIVPYVRGRERSRNPEDIINEVKRLVSQGIKEVTLLGQNVNSYGKDLGEKIDFADLLVMLEGIIGLERVRFMTSHPRDFTDKLITTISKTKKVCEHIHLPVQAGSSAVLKKMNRGYTAEKYLMLIEKIRKSFPGVSLTTDVIVGFPGETENDFQQTVDLMRQVKFDGAFIFIYNKRSGTPAAKMTGQISRKVKSERVQKLIALQNDFTLQSNSMEVGTVQEILVEGRSKTKDDKLSGRLRTNKLVVFNGNESCIGKLLPVKITGFSLTHLEGEPVLS